ncbi:outer membrane beta-barrel protein [Salmonella enterica]|nr:outer membrane beta-barrel protein [Salmonella enterica]
MKKTLLAVVAVSTLLGSSAVMADTDSLYAGYARVKPQDYKALNGFTLGYQHEFVNGWGMMTNFTYAKGDRKETGDETSLKYYSLMTGPSYRINDYVGLYGQLGLAHIKGKASVHYEDDCTEHFSQSKSALAWGAGIIVNPTDNFAITAGYEGSNFSVEDDKVSTNGFNVTVGYRF